MIMSTSRTSGNGRGMRRDVDVIHSPLSAVLREDVKFGGHGFLYKTGELEGCFPLCVA